MAAVLRRARQYQHVKGCGGALVEKELELGRNQGVWGVFGIGKSEGTDIPAQHTLLQICHHVAALLGKGTTIPA